MFSSAWFWISISAYFFNSNFNYYKSRGILNGTQIHKQSRLSAISMIGVLTFWVIGLFVAEKWWYPLGALGISLIGSGLVGALVDAILPRPVSTVIGAISPIISLLLTIALYIVWF